MTPQRLFGFTCSEREKTWVRDLAVLEVFWNVFVAAKRRSAAIIEAEDRSLMTMPPIEELRPFCLAQRNTIGLLEFWSYRSIDRLGQRYDTEPNRIAGISFESHLDEQTKQCG
jgi:hypothetical protein